MEGTETINKTCLICKSTKDIKMFVIGRNMCKTCRNIKIRDDYKNLLIDEKIEQKCNACENIKNIIDFHKGKKVCRICINKQRRQKYDNDEVYRKRVNQDTIKYRKKKGWVDNPLEQLKRKVRSNICRYLNSKNKRTMEYLGCSRCDYLKWLLKNDNNYNLDNHGKEWHIDHVIPLSHFNLENDEEKLVAFNWRNTMPLSCEENLKKNNKIIKSQIELHYKKLLEYHTENNIEMPQIYIDLFAKHLDDGKPLKLSLPLMDGNV